MSAPHDSSPPFSPSPPAPSEDTPEKVAAEDLLCLQSAIEEQQRGRQRLPSHSRAQEADVRAQLQHTELRLHQSMTQLEAAKRSAHAVRVRLEADAQAARARALEAREALGSTGVGDGIAIPHVRNPIVLHVVRPFVTLGLLTHPIDFAAMDGKPVHALFMVVSPIVPTHLRILAQLGFVLR